MGRIRAVSLLPTRAAAHALHHQRRRVAQLAAPQNAPATRPVPQRRSRLQATISRYPQRQGTLEASRHVDAYARSARYSVRRTSARLTSTYTEILTLPRPLTASLTVVPQ